MVSLERRSGYLQSINNNHLLSSFASFLEQKPVEDTTTADLNEIDKIYFELLIAIQKNSAENFEKPYSVLSKRLPNKNSPSPFVYNDYLIFILITGIVKFKYDKGWIKQIIGIRTKNNITVTFDNILKGDFLSRSNLHEIVLSFLNLTDPSKINKELQNDGYEKISHNEALFEERNDFLILCSLNTYNLIILSREMVDTKQLAHLVKFQTKFLKRVEILAYIIYNGALIFLYWYLMLVLSKEPALKSKVSDLGIIVGIIGITLANFLTKLRKLVEKGIVKLLGYDQ